MKKARIIIIAVLSVLCIFCITMFGCARPGGSTPTPSPTPGPTPGPGPGPDPDPPTPTGVVLVGENGDDFINTERIVEEQSVFDVSEYFYYRGTDGRRYRATWSIKKSDGSVFEEQIRYMIVIEDTAGYYIDLTVQTADNVTHTRRVTLVIGHTTPPTIMIGDFADDIGAVGTTYNVPTIKLTDVSGQTPASTVTCYYKSSPDAAEESVTLTNNKFTPTKAGYYGIRVVATNIYGVQNTATKEFLVRDSMSGAMIEDFSVEESKKNSVNCAIELTTVQPVWYETFQGRSGVVSSNSGTQQYPNFAFRSFKTLEQLKAYPSSDWDYISIWVWLDIAGNIDLYSRNVKFGTYPGRTWVELKLTKAIIESDDSWYKSHVESGETTTQAFFRLFSTGVWLFWGRVGNNVNAYVDEIRFVKEATVTLNGTHTGLIGNEVTLSAAASGVSGATFDYVVVDPNGCAVSLTNGNKFTPTEVGTYKVIVKLNHSKFGGSCTVDYTITSEKYIYYAQPTGSYTIGDEYTVPTAVVKDSQGGTVVGLTPTCTVTFGNGVVPVVNNKFTIEDAGLYTITYAVTVDGYNLTSKYQFSAEAPVTDTKTILDFTAESQASYVYGANGNPTISYLNSYEGAAGVVAVTYELQDWPAFSFKTPSDLSTYSGYGYLAVRMYVTEDYPMYYFKLVNDSEAVVEAVNPEILVGGWKEYLFPASAFYSFWSQANAGDFSKARIWMKAPRNSGSIYIDSIRLVNHERPEPAANEIEGFGTSDCLATMTMRNATMKDYVLDAPSGSSHGSAKFTLGSDTGPVFWLTPRQALEAYSAYDSISIVIKIESTGLDYVTLKFWYKSTQQIRVKTNEWTTIQVSMAEFKKNYDSLGNTSAASGWFWFTNSNGNAIQAILFNDIYATRQPDTSIGALVTMNASAEAKIVTQEASVVEWTTNNKGNITKPSDVDGMVVVTKSTASENSGFLNVGVTPDCSYFEFHDYDKILIRICVSQNAQLYYRNYPIQSITANTWTTVDMTKYVFTETMNVAYAFTTDMHMYDYFGNGLFLLKFTANTTITCAIAGLELGRETPDTTLGNKFAVLNTTNVTAGIVGASSTTPVTVTQGTFFGKSAVKVAYENSSSWVNIFVKPGKTYQELEDYSYVKVEMYVEGSATMQLYNQAALYGESANNIYSFSPNGENVWTDFAPNAWFTFKIPVQRVQDMWASLNNGRRALIIDRGAVYTAIYIASITCEA